MSNLASPPRAPLRDPRVWAACLGFWVGVVLLFHGTGAAGVVVNGRQMPFFSRPVLMSALELFGPFVLGTLAAVHLAPRLAAMRGARFWRASAVVVVALTTCHGFVSAVVYASPDFLWRGVMMYGFHYSAIVGVLVTVHQRRQDERSRRELQATQLRALRAQLQPHFLFNTLHTIGVTARQDGATAARMTTLLGDLLRQTLRDRNGALVSLAEEHELLQPYLQLQQLRFADRLRIDVDLSPEVLAGAVPDLLLQPLVENALQHGIEQRPGDGHVRVVARRVGDHLLIDVHDDGVALPAIGGEPVLGTGLGATKARLAALYGDGASLSLRANERGGTTASIRLPWREVAHAA